MDNRSLHDRVAEIEATPPAWRVVNDPYVRHLVELTISGKFSEPVALASLQNETFGRMGELVTHEEMYDAHWAPPSD